MAKGAAEVAPNVYKVLFENDRVRLLEVRMKPGDESAMHSHPDYLLYALSGGTVKLTAGSGESGEVDIAAGDAMWRDAEEHSALNTGTTELVVLDAQHIDAMPVATLRIPIRMPGGLHGNWVTDEQLSRRAE